MGNELTVIDSESGESTSCASVLKVLADETRLAVVEQLLSGPKHVGEVNETLGVEQSLLSHHLKVLRDAGLVTAERDGKQMLYSLSTSIQGSRSGRAINLGCCLISFD
jgi:ArsR family transcriptional regulator